MEFIESLAWTLYAALCVCGIVYLILLIIEQVRDSRIDQVLPDVAYTILSPDFTDSGKYEYVRWHPMGCFYDIKRDEVFYINYEGEYFKLLTDFCILDAAAARERVDELNSTLGGNSDA